MMQRIELTSEVSIARMIIDLESFFQSEPTTQAMMTYFEMSIEAGYDTFLIPTTDEALAVIEDVFLQRPYLKRQIQFLCQITPQQGQHHFVNTEYQAIIEEGERIYEQLDQSKFALGIIDVNDYLFDPLAVVASGQQLIANQIIGSIAIKQASCAQVAALSYYSEGDISVWYQPWSENFFFDEPKMTACFANQLLPLVKFVGDARLAVHPRMPELASRYQVSKEAIILAWVFAHPVKVLLVIDANTAKLWWQAYQEQLTFQLKREEWYQLCE